MAKKSFTIRCDKCKNPMTFTAKMKDGEPVPNPEKPGKFLWNPPVDADGERHNCNPSYKGMKVENCMYCGKKPCVCKYEHCPFCAEHFGWFIISEKKLAIHLKRGFHYDIHGQPL
jgi:hypothetical protein